jgi:DNA end-binding protein Ku
VDTVTGEVVESRNKGRGYEVGENQFLIVQDEELAAARQEARSRPFSAAPAQPTPAEASKDERKREAGPKLVETVQREEDPAASVEAPRRIENNRTIDLDRFVRGDQIDLRYFLAPYYIAPRDDVGEEAFAVIRDAMAAKGLVGMGRVVLASRERPIIIQPIKTGLLGMTLRYAHEVRSEVDYFENIRNMTLSRDIMQLAEHILETKTEDFDAAYLEDRYRTVLVEKLREKHARMPRKAATSAPSHQNVVSLMDALKRSLAVEGPRRSPPQGARLLLGRIDRPKNRSHEREGQLSFRAS